MTWVNIGSRMASLLIVLPMVLNRFGPADISLYYLFASIVSLQLICGSGFVPTLARFVTFILAGARLDDLSRNRLGRNREIIVCREADPFTLAVLLATMARTFVWVVCISTPIVAVVGTLFLLKPVAQSSAPLASWIAWGVVLTATPFVLLGNRYSAFLQGANRIALDQRWGAICVILGALSGLGAMVAGGGLLALIIANQVWQIIGYFRLRRLAAKTLRELAPNLPKVQPDKRYFAVMWPAAWRTLLGVVASSGIAAALGLVYAQFLAPKPLAELLLGVRVIAMIGEISRAPFYSKIPIFNALRSEGRTDELAALAQHSMRLSYAAFVIMALATPLSAQILLPLIGSQISFPSPIFWFWLAGAQLIERMGAMHIQLYSTTNHIVWHWLNGIHGAVWICLLVVLLPYLSIMAYPVGMFLAYVTCYSPVAAKYSLRSIGAKYWSFERTTFWPAAIGYIGGVLLLTRGLHV